METTGPTPSDSGPIKIGPSVWLIAIVFSLHPLAWIGALLGAFVAPWQWAALFRLRLHASIGFPAGQNALIDSYLWLKHFPVPLWAMCIGISALHAIIRYQTSRYELRDDMFFVQTGFFGLGNYGGFFSNYTNTIPMAVLTDCETKQPLLGKLFGTGTLIIRSGDPTSDGRPIILRHIRAHERARDLILPRAGVRNARMLTNTVNIS